METLLVDKTDVDSQVELTLVYGDCSEFLPRIKPKSVDLLITDPPYFIPSDAGQTRSQELMEYKTTLGDRAMLKQAFRSIIEKIQPLMSPKGFYYIFCNADSYPLLYEAIFPHIHRARDLVWDKQCSKLGYAWRHQHELILFATKEPDMTPTGDGDIIRCKSTPIEKKHHPAEKPVALIRRLILKHKQNKPLSILDPFLGTGTTLVACQQTNTNGIGIEIDPIMIEVAKKRLHWATPEPNHKHTYIDGTNGAQNTSREVD